MLLCHLIHFILEGIALSTPEEYDNLTINLYIMPIKIKDTRQGQTKTEKQCSETILVKFLDITKSSIKIKVLKDVNMLTREG